ncbi:MAG: hypothetical protein CBD58_02010 [bacterium TMED198]|nr:MAG: hypothetical protein CBD58_02010 [bacterium TMED198]|tara:strand:+ start:220 stop:924 length:705 start_codon:yes stop_codon:yes gene_type:complete
MNKDEIRHDPVKEKIVALVEYIIEKKTTFFYIALVLIVAIASISFYINNLNKNNKKGWELNQEAMSAFFNSLSSENLFSASIADSIELRTSIEKFNEIASQYPGTSSSDFAILNSLRGEVLLGNFEKVEDLVINSTLSSSDNSLNYQFNRLKGDILFDRSNYSEALNFYNKSISMSNSSDLSLPVKIKKIYVLMEMGEYGKAESIMSSIDRDEIGFSEKNTLIEIEYFLKNKAK